MVVLFAWSYFFAPTKPAGNTNTEIAAANTNTAQTPQAAPAAPVRSPSVQVECEEAIAKTQPELCAGATVVPDTAPARSVTIKSPLYEVTLDSKGAVASSWRLLRNRSSKSDYPVYADGSNSSNEKPLQLISDKALEQNPRELPFRLQTDDQVLNTDLNGRDYQISVPEDTISLAAGQEQTIDFTLTLGKGVTVKKSFVFRADSYLADLSVDLRQNGQPVPGTKLAIGASIGDHAINYHNLYHTESEAVVAVEILQEGFGKCSEDEGHPGQDQRLAEERHPG